MRSALFWGVLQPKSGSKNESSQNLLRALEVYISNVVESEYVNDFLICQRLGVAKIRIFDHVSSFLTHFIDFSEESGRTGARRFVIRNHHVRIYFPTFRLSPDPLNVRVTRGWCSTIFVAFLDFSKPRKT